MTHGTKLTLFVYKKTGQLQSEIVYLVFEKVLWSDTLPQGRNVGRKPDSNTSRYYAGSVLSHTVKGD